MATPRGRDWTFLSNHGHVLVALSRDPQSRLRDIAEVVGITERATQGVLKDLEEEGYVSKTRVGRRNEYQLNPELRLRHPAESATSIRDLLGIFQG
jgi:DNA-binding MarR family transcriptional regulator